MLWFAVRQSRWTSHGLLLLVAFIRKERREPVANKVASALSLIERFDRRRAERIRRDVQGVLVWPGTLPGAKGEFIPQYALVAIDSDFAQRSVNVAIALVIVHEATHARLRQIPYTDETAARIEVMCHRQEIAFARLLPESDELVAALQQDLEAMDPAIYTKVGQTEFALRNLEGQGVSPRVVSALRSTAGVLQGVFGMRR